MAKMIFLIFVVFLPIAALSEAICCDSIKSLVEKKIEANKTLCGAGSTLPPQCCKDIANMVKQFVDAYEAFCLNITSCTDPKALGMRSGKIPDDAITASSTYSGSYKPSYARLTKVGSSCSWTPTAAGRIGSWLQVDLGQLSTVTGIATQGTCYSSTEWATSYSVSYSNEPNSWTLYEESGNVKVFQANTDRSSIVTHSFKSPIRARYIRVLPKSWSNYPTMRLELYGCRH
ncbi:Hypothetical predicted protein [Paramuricea clavata]|uniref:Uncharacterized protein n=1 Tax=Paramuricea clavata TaxID=317549 RepID=A0A6S7GSZ5_PARCT|nr:Hypothetical predicted protein [Paramuricea clavata]